MLRKGVSLTKSSLLNPVNVIDHAQQRTPIFDQQGLVAAFKHVAMISNHAVETIGEGTLQPLHSRDKIRILSF